MNAYAFILSVVAWVMIAFFSGIEVAFLRANRLAIELRKKQGLNSGIVLANFVEHPGQFIGTTLTGFNISLVIFGLMVSETFLPAWHWFLATTHIVTSWGNAMLLFAEIMAASLFILLFGEFFPKALFRAKSNTLLSFFARTMEFLNKLLFPIAAFFAAIAQWILKYVFNVRMDERKGIISVTDHDRFLQQTRDTEEDANDLNKNLFEAALALPKVKVRECLVPRKEIEGIDINAGMEEVRRKFV